MGILYQKDGFISIYGRVEEMEWNDLVELVENYLVEAELGPIDDVVKLLIKSGNGNEDEREAASASIKSVLQGREGSPFRQGVRTTLPIKVKVNIDTVSRMVEQGSLIYFEMVPPLLHKKHGKSGGGGYTNAIEYAKNERRKIKVDLQRRFQKGAWDGTLESLGYTSPYNWFEEE